MLFSTAVKQFIEERIAMRYSPHTIRDYGVTYKKFLAHVGDVDIGAVNKQHIIQFMASQSKVSAKTLQIMLPIYRRCGNGQFSKEYAINTRFVRSKHRQQKRKR